MSFLTDWAYDQDDVDSFFSILLCIGLLGGLMLGLFLSPQAIAFSDVCAVVLAITCGVALYKFLPFKDVEAGLFTGVPALLLISSSSIVYFLRVILHRVG